MKATMNEYSPAGAVMIFTMVLAMGVGLVVPAWGQVCPAQAGRSAMSYTNPLVVSDMVVRGIHAYGADAYGLGAWDVSDPEHPAHVAHWLAPEHTTGLALGPENLVLLADAGSGLIVIDVTDPAQPHKVGSYDTPGVAMGVAVSGRTAYVADGSSGLQIIDISDPASPRLLGSYDTLGNAGSLAVSGSTVYLADGTSGLQIIDVSDPAKPKLLGMHVAPSAVVRVAVSGASAFITLGDAGIQIIDVRDSANPRLLGTYDTQGYALGVTVLGTNVFVADGDAGIQIIDVSDPANPSFLGAYDTQGSARSVTLSGATVYTAELYADVGFEIIDVSDPSRPGFLGAYDTPGNARSVAVSGSTAYVANLSSGLEILDVSDAAEPRLVRAYDTPGDVYDVTVSGTTAYVADGDAGLQIIDVSHPAEPKLVGTYDTEGFAIGVTVSGATAYVADADAGLQIISVNDPANPKLLGTYDTQGYAMGVTVSGTAAYVADGDAGLQVIDVSSPASPKLLGAYDTPGFSWSVAVSRGTAYVADGASGLRILDVSDPAIPWPVGFYVANALDVATSGTTAFVTDPSIGLHILDVSDPAEPRFLAVHATPGTATGVFVSGSTAYLADHVDFVIVTSECRAPQAAFGWHALDLNVELRDRSLYQPTTWSWDLGDGSTSSERSPSHRYDTAGTYTVKLTVTNAEGTDSISHTVTVESGIPGIDDPGEHLSMISGSAHSAGVSQTLWVSDVVLWNGCASDAEANIFFLKSGEDNSGAQAVQLSVPAGASLKLEDVVGTTFGQSRAAGAILVGSDHELVVTSRTYNDSVSGTYGQFIAGQLVSEATAVNEDARLIQLTRNGDYRTNIGFANSTGGTLKVKVELYQSDGSPIATRSYTIQPYGFYQKTDILGTDVSDAYAVVSSPTAGAAFFTFASVIDNRTGDPLFVTPGAGTASTGQVLYIPGSAHVNGAGGTRWRSDLEIHNPGSTAASYAIELLKRDRANPSPQSKSFDLSPGQSARYEDVLSSLFGFTGAAALRITPSGGTITVTSRTYNQAPNGTYGQFIPAVLASEAIVQGESVPLIQLADSASTDRGYRTNIGFLNTSDAPITIQADLYGGDGTKLGTKMVDLERYEYTQVDRIFRMVTSLALDDCFAILSTATPGGHFLAYGSVVDNRSGDPVYVPADGGGDSNTIVR